MQPPRAVAVAAAFMACLEWRRPPVRSVRCAGVAPCKRKLNKLVKIFLDVGTRGHIEKVCARAAARAFLLCSIGAC
eukprot:203116-Prymnesium_polylepis.1